MIKQRLKLILILLAVLIVGSAVYLYFEHLAPVRLDKEEQITRLEKRCPEKLEAFRTRWIPLEEAYIAATSVLERADEIV